MTLTTKTPDELTALKAAVRESLAAIEAEEARRQQEEAEKARKRVRPLVQPGSLVRRLHDASKRGDDEWLIGLNCDNIRNSGRDLDRTTRVLAYAECMAKVAESWLTETYAEAGYNHTDALEWCADMIAERESAAHRIQAARAAGFID